MVRPFENVPLNISNRGRMILRGERVLMNKCDKAIGAKIQTSAHAALVS